MSLSNVIVYHERKNQVNIAQPNRQFNTISSDTPSQQPTISVIATTTSLPVSSPSTDDMTVAETVRVRIKLKQLESGVGPLVNI